jgi:putative DNA primase/helicase
LTDIQEIFSTLKGTKIFKEELYRRLILDDEKTWGTYNRGKPISWSQVAKMLKPYGISTKQIRIGHESLKGFDVAQFTDAFNRYLSDDVSVKNVPSKRNNEENETLRPAWIKDCFDVSNVSRNNEGMEEYSDLI